MRAITIQLIAEQMKAEDILHKSRFYLKNLRDSIGDSEFLIKMPERKIKWNIDSINLVGYDPNCHTLLDLSCT